MINTSSCCDAYRYWKLKDIQHTLEGFCLAELHYDDDLKYQLSKAAEMIYEVSVEYARRYGEQQA